MSKNTLIICSEEPEVATALASLLETIKGCDVIAQVHDVSLLPDELEKLTPRFLVTDLGHGPHAMLDGLERLAEPRPIQIVLGSEDQSDVILRALKLGVREFLPDSSSPEHIVEVIQGLAAQTLSAGTDSSSEAGVVAVMGAKGGVGATLVGCQLAGSLQRSGGRTAIVDLNSPLGDVAVYFDVQPTYTLADIARAGKRIDATLIGELLHRHGPTGVEVLAAPSRLENAQLVSKDHIGSLIKQLKSQFDWVVLDLSRSWSENSMRAVDLVDHFILVALQDVPSLNHARSHRDLLLRIGVDARSIHTVVNRQSKEAAVSSDDMTKFLGAEPEFSLPNDYVTAVTCVNEGRPVSDVAPGSAIDRAFVELAIRVHEWHGVAAPPVPAEARRGVRSRIRNMFERR
jgi:pilus assembly protein CpaE